MKQSDEVVETVTNSLCVSAGSGTSNTNNSLMTSPHQTMQQHQNQQQGPQGTRRVMLVPQQQGARPVQFPWQQHHHHQPSSQQHQQHQHQQHAGQGQSNPVTAAASGPVPAHQFVYQIGGGASPGGHVGPVGPAGASPPTMAIGVLPGRTVPATALGLITNGATYFMQAPPTQPTPQAQHPHRHRHHQAPQDSTRVSQHQHHQQQKQNRAPASRLSPGSISGVSVKGEVTIDDGPSAGNGISDPGDKSETRGGAGGSNTVTSSSKGRQQQKRLHRASDKPGNTNDGEGDGDDLVTFPSQSQPLGRTPGCASPSLGGGDASADDASAASFSSAAAAAVAAVADVAGVPTTAAPGGNRVAIGRTSQTQSIRQSPQQQPARQKRKYGKRKKSDGGSPSPGNSGKKHPSSSPSMASITQGASSQLKGAPKGPMGPTGRQQRRTQHSQKRPLSVNAQGDTAIGQMPSPAAGSGMNSGRPVVINYYLDGRQDQQTQQQGSGAVIVGGGRISTASAAGSSGVTSEGQYDDAIAFASSDPGLGHRMLPPSALTHRHMESQQLPGMAVRSFTRRRVDDVLPGTDSVVLNRVGGINGASGTVSSSQGGSGNGNSRHHRLVPPADVEIVHIDDDGDADDGDMDHPRDQRQEKRKAPLSASSTTYRHKSKRETEGISGGSPKVSGTEKTQQRQRLSQDAPRNPLVAREQSKAFNKIINSRPTGSIPHSALRSSDNSRDAALAQQNPLQSDASESVESLIGVNGTSGLLVSDASSGLPSGGQTGTKSKGNEDGTMPDLNIDYSLAGPFVQGLITGNPETLESIEGDAETSLNEITSKLVLSVTKDADSALDTSMVTVSLAEMEAVASEVVLDRRSAMKEAVRFAFIEMKKRHDTIMGLFQRHVGEVIRREMTKRRSAETEVREATRDMKRAKLMHDDEIKKLKREQERVVKELVRSHQEEITEIKKDLGNLKKNQTRSLDAFRMASAEALKFCKK